MVELNNNPQKIFIDKIHGRNSLPLPSEKLSTHVSIEFGLEVCIFYIWIGVKVVFGCREDEEMVPEGNKKGIDVIGLNNG